LLLDDAGRQRENERRVLVVKINESRGFAAGYTADDVFTRFFRAPVSYL